MTSKEIRAIAEELERTYNPYKAGAKAYIRRGEEVYMWNGKTYTAEEIKEGYIETASKDIKNGYEERMVGYYDKWYRYNRTDEGRAYDKGCARATTMKSCPEELNIIPCMH